MSYSSRRIEESERVSRRAVMGSLALLALATSFAPSSAYAGSDEEVFVRSNIEKSYAILNHEAPDKQAEFRAQLLSFVDTKRIALFALGPYARGQSQPDLDVFQAAFADYLVAVYERGLDLYRGRTLEVTGSTEHGPGDVIVSAIVDDQDMAKTHIDFRVREQPGGAKVITDLQVEGVWLALNQREQFMTYLQQHHGHLPELSSELQRKASQMEAESRKPNGESTGKRAK